MAGQAAVVAANARLFEDVEAEREDRRAAAGHVEPRAARAFLALAREPGALAVDWVVVNVSPAKHRGYAVQWFAFAVIALVGAVLLTRRY